MVIEQMRNAFGFDENEILQVSGQQLVTVSTLNSLTLKTFNVLGVG
jgi:hypothetical protein